MLEKLFINPETSYIHVNYSRCPSTIERIALKSRDQTQLFKSENLVNPGSVL